jgi:hypothetical protein
MLGSLADQAPGRPETKVPPGQTKFEKQMAKLKREKERLEQELVLKDIVFDLHIR